MTKTASDQRIPSRGAGKPTLQLVALVLLAAAPMALAQEEVANNPPTACAATYTTSPGITLNITLTGTDPDGDELEFIITALPSVGTLRCGPSDLEATDLPYACPISTLSFIAAAGDSGQCSLTFKANDGTDESAAVATITINVQSPPVVNATELSTEPDVDLKFNLPVSDADGDLLEYTISSLPGHGRLTQGSTMLTDEDIPFVTTAAGLVYSPDMAFHGPDTFRFSATDGTDSTGTTTITFHVNTTPVPNTITVTVLPDNLTTITLTSTDADRDEVEYTIVSLPVHGMLRLHGMPLSAGEMPMALGADINDVEYMVDLGYSGTDSFHYRVSDGTSMSDRAVVVIYVNTPPEPQDTDLVLDEEGTASGVLMPWDADGDTLTVRITQLPACGELKLNGRAVHNTETPYTVDSAGLPIEYTIDAEAAADQVSDSFLYVVSDGKQESLSGQVLIRFTADDPTGDGDDDPSDDEVLPDLPGVPTPACGPAGVIELAAMALMLLFVSAGRIRPEFATSTPK